MKKLKKKPKSVKDNCDFPHLQTATQTLKASDNWGIARKSSRNIRKLKLLQISAFWQFEDIVEKDEDERDDDEKLSFNERKKSDEIWMQQFVNIFL